MRLVFHRGDDAAEADRLASALSEQLSLPDDGPGGKSDKTPGYLAPLVLANASVKWTLFCFSSAVVGPMIALLWRTRRYLADATAIQLTRDPDALWSALSRLVREGGVVSGSGSASYLFIVGPESGGMRRMGIGRRGADDKLGTGSMVSFHPPIGKRLERVRAQGATAVADEAPARKSRPPLFVSALMVFAWSLYGIAMVAAFAGVAVFLFTAVFLSAFFLGLIHVAFYLLGTLVRWLL